MVMVLSSINQEYSPSQIFPDSIVSSLEAVGLLIILLVLLISLVLAMKMGYTIVVSASKKTGLKFEVTKGNSRDASKEETKKDKKTRKRKKRKNKTKGKKRKGCASNKKRNKKSMTKQVGNNVN